jgi:hypothetical protein
MLIHTPEGFESKEIESKQGLLQSKKHKIFCENQQLSDQRAYYAPSSLL